MAGQVGPVVAGQVGPVVAGQVGPVVAGRVRSGQGGLTQPVNFQNLPALPDP